MPTFTVGPVHAGCGLAPFNREPGPESEPGQDGPGGTADSLTGPTAAALTSVPCRARGGSASAGRGWAPPSFLSLPPSFAVQKCGEWGLKAQTLVRDATSHPALEPSLVPYQHDLRQGGFSALGWCGLTVVMPWAKCCAHTGGAAVTTCQTQNRAGGLWAVGVQALRSPVSCLFSCLSGLYLFSHPITRMHCPPVVTTYVVSSLAKCPPVSLRYYCPSWMHRRGLLGH